MAIVESHHSKTVRNRSGNPGVNVMIPWLVICVPRVRGLGEAAMTREDAEKLLGGYAAGTLTRAEREALFAAALGDQAFFESLIREQPVRELLQDAAARWRPLAQTDESPEPWYCRELSPAMIAVALAAFVACTVTLTWRPWPVRLPVDLTQLVPQVVTVHPGVKPFKAPQPVPSPLPTELPPAPDLPPASSGESLRLSQAPPSPPPPGATADHAAGPLSPSAELPSVEAPPPVTLRYR